MASNTIPWQPNPAGYVSPSSISGELNDLELRTFLQQIIVGITGLSGQLVFPRWQAEEPNQPDFSETWAAIGGVRRTRDDFAAVIHLPGTPDDNFVNSSDLVNRNQILDVLVSFYGPEAEAASELFAMGIFLEQNRYQLQVNGFGLVAVEESLVVPALIKERWVNGIDIHFRLRRQQDYLYPVPNVAAVNGTVQDDLGDPAVKLKVDSEYGKNLGGYGVQPYDTGGNP